MTRNVNMLFPDHVEQVNGLQVTLKGEDQKEWRGCRPPPPAAVSEVFMAEEDGHPSGQSQGEGSTWTEACPSPRSPSIAPSCA